MRKFIVFLAVGVLAASAASAAILWEESFSYPDGDITAVSGGVWVNHSGTGTDVQILNGQAVANSASYPDVNHQFRTQAEATATDVIYFSFNMKVTGTQTTTAYFAHFMNTGLTFVGRVWVGLNDATTYKLGINSGNTAPTSFWPTMLTKDVFYTVVVRYNAATGVSTLWVNPVNEASPSIDGVTPTIGALISGFAIREASGYGVVTIDDLKIFNVWDGPVATENETWGNLKMQYK